MCATIVVWAGIKRRSNYEWCVCVCVSQTVSVVMGSVSRVALGDSQGGEDVGRACGVEPTDSSRRRKQKFVCVCVYGYAL